MKKLKFKIILLWYALTSKNLILVSKIKKNGNKITCHTINCTDYDEETDFFIMLNAATDKCNQIIKHQK